MFSAQKCKEIMKMVFASGDCAELLRYDTIIDLVHGHSCQS